MADGAATPDADALRLSLRPPALQMAEQEDEVLVKGAAAFGGREDSLAVYKKARELIAQYDVFRLTQIEHVGTATHHVICNLWRVEREPGQNLTFSERNLETGQWEAVTPNEKSWKAWPSFHLWPIHGNNDKYWRYLVETVISRVLNASGFGELPNLRQEVYDDAEDLEIAEEIALAERRRVPELLNERYQGCEGRNSPRWTDGLLTPWVMRRAARALRADFFEFIADKELFSAAIAIDYEGVFWQFYLFLGSQRDAVLRVARERRNLLPLLRWIQRQHWVRSDLFSKALWVRGDRKSTIVDRSNFHVTGEHTRLHLSSFRSPHSWHWLARASVTVVSTWVTIGRGRMREQTVEALARANVSRRVPVTAIRKYMTLAAQVFDHCLDLEQETRVARVYLMHTAKLWEKDGFSAVRDWVGRRSRIEDEFREIRDYLVGEGSALGFPQKNSTWSSLLVQSRDWHTRIRIEAMRQKEASARLINWKSALSECKVDGFTFTPLTSAWELAVEGYEMHHCVGGHGYAGYCKAGRARIFAVKGSAKQRATLELGISRKKVTVRQLQGFHNIPDDIENFPAMERAANKLAAMYQDALVTKNQMASLVDHMRRSA